MPNKNLKKSKDNLKLFAFTKRLLLISTAFFFVFFHFSTANTQSLFVRNNFPVQNTILQPSFEQFDFYNGKKYNFNILFQYSNTFAYSEIDNPEIDNSIIFDMETAYTLFRMEKRLNAFSSFYIELPFTCNWKGIFDSAIENYHDIIGFSNGGRENYPQNVFRYKFGQIDIKDSVTGIGDIKLGYSIFKIRDISNFKFAIGFFAKLPTGSVDKGLSSGSFDWGAKASFSNNFDYFKLDYGFGWIIYGSKKSNFSANLTSSGFGYLALSSSITENIKGVVQLYLSSSPFSTGYDRLDDYQAMLSIGIHYKQWQFSFSEDVFTYTAPDITVSINRKIGF
jgi:hypothetical protein